MSRASNIIEVCRGRCTGSRGALQLLFKGVVEADEGTTHTCAEMLLLLLPFRLAVLTVVVFVDGLEW